MQSIWAMLSAFSEKYLFWLNKPNVTAVDIIEMIIIAFLFYNIMIWIKDTRAWMLFKGILVILICVLIAAILQMNTILWIASKTINVAVIAIVVIFQPEMRKALEQIGKKRYLSQFFNFDVSKNDEKRYSDKTINELVKATYEMGKVKTGALIVIEKDIRLAEYERTGIAIDGMVTGQLLINIFEHNTPLHDGAVIIRGDRVVSATCYLPLSDNMELSKDLGTRHRAAVGISEVSDSLTIVVSEETGKVSLAVDGKLYHDVPAEYLRKELNELQNIQADSKRFGFWKRRLKEDEKDIEKTDE
ncbi:MAG: diadenylate cyclase CdaA [Lachnospiraceae bacterium]